MLRLYSLRVSNFSEKARWALDRKGLAYEERQLVPGFHALVVRRLAGSWTVPVLQDSERGRLVNDSTDILHYLDEIAPEPRLFPADPARRQRVQEIESFMDERCAPHVAGFLYSHALRSPRLISAIWQVGLPPAKRLLVRLSAPVLLPLMKRARRLDERGGREHRERLEQALEVVDGWVRQAGEGPLVGEAFSAADLTVAALLGPLLRPPGSPWDLQAAGIEPPPGYPPREVVEVVERAMQRPSGRWVTETWRRHRRATAER